MCLLSYFPPGVQPDADALRCGARCNNDGHGFGIVIPGQDGILVFKSMNPTEAVDAFVKARAEHPHGPALFHSRLTTHGETNTANCHPFVVNGDPRTVVAHNGILPSDAHPKKIGTTKITKHGKDGVPYEIITGVYDDRSDTRILADDLLMTRWATLDSRHTRKRLTKWLGRSNKILVLTTDPKYRRQSYLLNSELGEWVGGVWYSNSSFRGYGRGTSSYGSWYGSGVYANDPRYPGSADLERWDDDWDMPTGTRKNYDDEAEYGYVKNDRGVWVPPKGDRFRHANDDPSTWPVTLGGTRTTPQARTPRTAQGPWVTYVTCDLCQAVSVDVEYGVCYDCEACQDCGLDMIACHCYGSPRPYSYTYGALAEAIRGNRPSATIRMALRDYRKVCATFQAVADQRDSRRALATGPATEEEVSATIESLRAAAAKYDPAFSDSPKVGMSADGRVSVEVSKN